MIEQRIAECVEMFRRRCARDRLHLTGDDRVSEESAAALIGLSAGTLRNLRALREGPIPFRAGLHGGRISYRLIDLSRWIEERRGWRDD